MKIILIPTDFSENAGDALAYALDFIGDFEARLHIVNTVSITIGNPEAAVAASEMARVQMNNAKENMKALQAMSAMQNRPNIDVTTNVIEGTTISTIKDEAKQINADIIVMGTRGNGHGTMDKLLGTISTGVIDNAPCPVVLIPRGYLYKKMDNIIFSTNLNHGDPYELWRALETVKPHDPTVRCVHVVKDDKAQESLEIETFAKYMIEKSPATETIFNIETGKQIEDVLEKYAEDYDAELIVMHREKKNLWQKVIGRSHTKRMSSVMRVPLMVIN